MKVDQKSVQDFINILQKYNIEFFCEVLTMFHEGNYYSNYDMGQIEHKAVVEVTWKYCNRYQKYKKDEIGVTIKFLISDFIRELQNYLPEYRALVIEAVLKKIAGPIENIHRLRAMVPGIKSAWQNMDPRTKAFMKILDTLIYLQEEIGEDFYNFVLDGSGDVDFLRNDPKLAPLVQAYDLAESCQTAEIK